MPRDSPHCGTPSYRGPERTLPLGQVVQALAQSEDVGGSAPEGGLKRVSIKRQRGRSNTDAQYSDLERSGRSLPNRPKIPDDSRGGPEISFSARIRATDFDSCSILGCVRGEAQCGLCSVGCRIQGPSVVGNKSDQQESGRIQASGARNCTGFCFRQAWLRSRL